MKTFIFQKFNFNYIFFLLYLTCCLMTTFVELYEGGKEEGAINGNFWKLINLYAVWISDFLAFILYYIKLSRTQEKNISKKMTKEEEISDESSTRKESMFIYNNVYEDQLIKKSRKACSYSVFVALLDFAAQVLLFIFYWHKKIVMNNDANVLLNSSVIFRIIFQYALSKFILKTNLYKHHYLSIFINTIFFFTLFILDILNNSFTWDFILAYSFANMLLVLENTYGKKAMIFGYISPYTLLIYNAIYKSCFYFAFSIIFIPIILSYENEFFSDIGSHVTRNTILVFVNIIFSFLKHLFNWILIDRFSPNHLALSFITEDLSYKIIAIILSKKQIYTGIEFVYRIIVYLILFITALIHNEIFIINKCGLANNTKLFLDEKVNEENILSSLDGDNNELLKRYDTMIELEDNVNNSEETGHTPEEQNNNM